MAEQHGKTLVPQIRFAGFTDPWEQRKLGELFEESDERASDREILSVSVANGIYPASESDRETNPGASLANYKVVHSGDVVYNSMRMWQGAVDASRYDGIVSPAYVVAKPNSEVYARFFARLLRQPMLLKQYQQVSQGNSKDTQVLKFDDFASIEISMPASENEQRRIGAFFDRLDSLITLHQRKYDKLCVLKKSMLDKMFPKGGSLYPEIRFAGFTDPWEQRKLGEVASGFEYGLNAAASDFDGEKKYLRITDIDDQTREFRTDDLSSPDINNPIDDRYLLKEGDILFARTGASVGKTYLYKASDGKTYYAGFLIRAHVSDEADAGFIFQSTLTERYKQFVLLTSQRSGQPGINAQEYSDLLLPLPSLMEQRRIGAFFDRLDSLITLHQRKLELLRNIKKSMLDKMFV